MTGTVREVAAFEDTENLVEATNAARGHLVRPAYVLVNRGDTVRWVNGTNEGLVLKAPKLGVTQITSEAAQDLELEIQASRGVYDYELKTSSGKLFKGESKPEIIVR